MQGGWRGFLDVQVPMHVSGEQNPQQHQSFNVQPQEIEVVYPFGDISLQDSDPQVPLLDRIREVEAVKNYAYNEDTLNVTEDIDCFWQRVKWTSTMVKLLITTVSYLGEGAFASSVGGRRKSSLLPPKKGKWKVISKVIVERGYHVSPQQCEDKFNDLNKKYKRLNFILGRGTSCKVVENPALLDSMDLSERDKCDVRKILRCKQLFYKELCSFHNGNRLHLPHDRALQQSLLLALKSRDDKESHSVRPCKPHEEFGEIEDEKNSNDSSQDHALHEDIITSAKWQKQDKQDELENVGISLNPEDCSQESDAPQFNACDDVNCVFTETMEEELLQNKWTMPRSLHLTGERSKFQSQFLELEKQRILSSNLRQDRELGKMMLENELFKLENLQLAVELKNREARAGYN